MILKINLIVVFLISCFFISCTGKSEMDQLAKELAQLNCDVTSYEETLITLDFESEEYNQLITDLEILINKRTDLLNLIADTYYTDEEFDRFFQVYEEKHMKYCKNK